MKKKEVPKFTAGSESKSGVKHHSINQSILPFYYIPSREILEFPSVINFDIITSINQSVLPFYYIPSREILEFPSVINFDILVMISKFITLGNSRISRLGI